MNTRIKERKIYNQHYDCNISYLIGGTVPQLKNFIKDRHKDAPMYSWSTPFTWGKDADTTNAYQFHVNSPLGHEEVFYVWIHEVSFNLLYHETSHLVGDILHTRGIKYSYSSEEAFSYLGGWIFEEICKLLRCNIKGYR